MGKEKTKSIKGYGLKSTIGSADKGDKIPKVQSVGTYYGSGIKNPVARTLSVAMEINPMSKKKLSKPPKSLA